MLNRANESNRKGVPFFETMLFFCHLGKNDWLSANQSVENKKIKIDYQKVVPEVNQEVKDILMDGMNF